MPGIQLTKDELQKDLSLLKERVTQVAIMDLMADMQTPKDDAQARLASMEGIPKPGEVYGHYKGGLYSIVCVSVKEDTLDILVIYHSNLKGCNWTRTLEDFTAPVQWVDMITRPRFVRMKA